MVVFLFVLASLCLFKSIWVCLRLGCPKNLVAYHSVPYQNDMFGVYYTPFSGAYSHSLLDIYIYIYYIYIYRHMDNCTTKSYYVYIYIYTHDMRLNLYAMNMIPIIGDPHFPLRSSVIPMTSDVFGAGATRHPRATVTRNALAAATSCGVVRPEAEVHDGHQRLPRLTYLTILWVIYMVYSNIIYGIYIYIVTYLPSGNLT